MYAAGTSSAEEVPQPNARPADRAGKAAPVSYTHLDQAQTLKALREAESYPGPAIVICYCPCLEQHIKAGMSCTQDEMKKAVECGCLLYTSSEN